MCKILLKLLGVIMLNIYYLTVNTVPGLAVLLTNQNKNYIINTIVNAIYFNYNKINYHKIMTGIADTYQLINQTNTINDIIDIQPFLENYQLNLINSNNVKNYIRSYEPELYFVYTKEKIEYIFQQFSQHSQIKIQHDQIEFHSYFLNELVNHIKKMKSNTKCSDLFITQYLNTYNNINHISVTEYIKNVLKDLIALDCKINKI